MAGDAGRAGADGKRSDDDETGACPPRPAPVSSGRAGATAAPARPPPSSSSSTVPVVYIFDLDECLLLMESLRCGSYAAATGADDAATRLCGAKLTAAVLEASDGRLGYGRLEDTAGPGALACCPATLEEGAALPDPAGAAFAAAASLAAAGKVLTPEQAARAAGLRAAADSLTGGWLASASRLLAGLQAAGGAGRGLAPLPPRPVECLVVTAGHPLPTVAKLSIFGLAPFFRGPGSVLSSRGLPDGKAGAFRRLANEAGRLGATFVVIGDGPEEEGAAGERGWPFVRVGPVAAGGEFGDEDGRGLRHRPDALGRQMTPIPRLTVLDLRRAAGLL